MYFVGSGSNLYFVLVAAGMYVCNIMLSLEAGFLLDEIDFYS